MKYNTPQRNGKKTQATTPTCGDLAVDFIGDQLNHERRFLAASWLCPHRMHEVAVDHDLRPGDFTDPCHGFIFSYLGLNVEHGRTDKVSVADCVAAAEAGAVGLDYDYVMEDLLLPMVALFITDPADELDELAQLLKAGGRRRREAQEHLDEAKRLLAGQPEWTVDTDCTTETNIVHHYRKGSRRGRRGKTAVQN
jgi:hypothetical protein